MSLIEMVPDRILGDMGGPDDEPALERRNNHVPVGAEPIGRDSGAAIGSAITALVQMPDREIAKNNRLSLLMQQHRSWAAKKQQHEVEQMARQTQGCEGCGKVKALSMCSGELLCSTCASLSGVLSKDPGVIAKRAIKRDVAEALLGQLIQQNGGEWFTRQAQQYLPEEVKVDLAKGQLDAIAFRVGYKGDDVEGLMEHIDNICFEIERLQNFHFSDQITMKQISVISVRSEDALSELHVTASNYLEQIEKMEHAEALLINGVRKVDVARKLPPRLSITENDLSDIATLIRYHVNVLQNIHDVIDLPECPVDDLLEAINQAKVNAEGFATLYQSKVDELTLVTDQLADAERRLAATPSISCQACDDKDAIDQIINHLSLDTDATHAEVIDAVADLLQEDLLHEQIFVKLRDIIDADAMPVGDLPAAIESLLYAGGDSFPSRGNAAALDSQLLDIILTHPQVPLEHVAAIRGAA